MTVERQIAFLYGAHRKWTLPEALNLCGRVVDAVAFGRPIGRWKVTAARTRDMGVWVTMEPAPDEMPLTVRASPVWIAPVGTLPGEPGWEQATDVSALVGEDG